MNGTRSREQAFFDRNVQVFARGHRVCGHNLLAWVLTGAILGNIDYCFDVSGQLAKRATAWAMPQDSLKLLTIRRPDRGLSI